MRRATGGVYLMTGKGPVEVSAYLCGFPLLLGPDRGDRRFSGRAGVIAAPPLSGTRCGGNGLPVPIPARAVGPAVLALPSGAVSRILLGECGVAEE